MHSFLIAALFVAMVLAPVLSAQLMSIFPLKLRVRLLRPGEVKVERRVQERRVMRRTIRNGYLRYERRKNSDRRSRSLAAPSKP